MIKDKEYIKECDCKEIQTLKEWNPYNNWVPTGDELDDEIEKTCKGKYERHNWNYYRTSGIDASMRMRYYAYIADNQDRPIVGDTCAIFTNRNIAKIKLLKQILKESV